MLRKSFFVTCLLMFALFAICLVSCDDDNDDSEATATIEYEVGDKGPAGGIIFYDCDADNGNEENDGLESSVCNWRYLEAAPADLKIVAGVPTVNSSAEGYDIEEGRYVFGYYKTYSDGDYLFVNGTTSYNISNCTGTAIGTGKTNTDKLVGAMGTSAYLSSSGSSDITTDYAARLCYILEYEKDGKTYDDWFLPSKEELNLMYTKFHEQGLGDFDNSSNWPYYWSSSESNNFASNARLQNFSNGNPGSIGRNNFYRVRPVRAF